MDAMSISGKSTTTTNKSQKIKNLEELIKAAAQRREEEINPERKLLFRPKIYESWKDGDEDVEIEIRKKMLLDIANKQLLLAEKKSYMTVDDDDEDEINDEKKEINETLSRLRTRKAREAAYKKRIAAYELKMKEERIRRDQELFESERHNPSKYGFFYGDGYYESNGYFGIKEELIEQLAEEGEEWSERWISKYPETFTEKFIRFFWPPKLLVKKLIFRTRGSYMDFPEVIADWPKSIDVTYDRQKVEMLSSSLPIFTPNQDGELLEIGIVTQILKTAEEEAAEQERLQNDEEQARQDELEALENERLYYGGGGNKGGLFGFFGKKGNKVAPKKQLGADDFYYDDELGEFYPKKYGFEIEYHFDGNASVWRRKRKENKLEKQITPYDFYWDQESGSFLQRADYVGTHTFEYDEAIGIYKEVIAVKHLPVPVPATRIPEGKIKTKSDNKIADYYYDEMEGKWSLKSSVENALDVTFDENGKRFARRSEGNWRGLTGFSPDDYYFDDTTGKFYPKPPRQGNNFRYYSEDGVWRKIVVTVPKVQKGKTKTKCKDYFFDLLEGQFKLREAGHDSKYEWQKYAKIYFRRPDPKSGLFPEDYYWDRHRKLWIPRVLRLDMLQNASSVAHYKAADKGKGIAVPDVQERYFWDTEEGEFFKKEQFDRYYFDDKEGVWKSERLKNKTKNRKYPHDFYFDEGKKTFLEKDKNAEDKTYEYDEKEGVWKLPGASKGGGNRPKDFGFDVELQKWVSIGELGTPSTNETNGTAYKKSPNIKIPDDFWFHDSEGRFYPKKAEDAGKYYFSSSDGVWKQKGITGPSTTGLTPRSFFFDDYAFAFRLRVVGQDRDYYYDKNNRIYRSVISLGKTRNGLTPADFRYNSELGAYVLKKTYDKSRGVIFNEDLQWDPQRDYDKPWLDSQTTSLATTTTEAPSERTKTDAKQKKKK